MAEFDFPSVPFEEAIAALKRRGLKFIPSDRWAEVWQEQHHTGFTVARSAGFDILGDIHAALVKAMEQGTPYRDFARDLVPILQKKGWWGRTETVDPVTGEISTVQLGSLRRLETIFDVNLRVSHAQGQWERHLAVADTHPYLVYDCVLDERTRRQHRRWYRLVLPVTDPFWQTHYPPNGWYCRCDVFSASADDIARMGLTVSRSPTIRMTPWTNPVTGEIIMVPDGIDPGWAYNPGNTDVAAKNAKIAMDKLINKPPSLGAEAITRMAYAFPQVERELGEWVESLANRERFAVGDVRVVGCIRADVLRWLQDNTDVTPETAAITIRDGEVRHMVRPAKEKRGHKIPLEDFRRLPTLLMEPDAVYWDNGGGKAQGRDPSLVYVWETDKEGAGKIVVRVNFDLGRGRKRQLTNSIRSGRIGVDPERNFNEESGYIEIKRNL